MPYCEERAANEGTVADINIESQISSVKKWRILILSCIISLPWTTEKDDKHAYAFCLIAKLLTFIVLNIITCDGDDIKADVSMCYVLLAFPDFF